MTVSTHPLQIGIDALIAGILAPLISLVPSLLSALLVLFIGYILGRKLDEQVYNLAWARKFDEKALKTPLKLFIDGEEDALAHLLGTLIRYLTFALAITVSVSFLDIRELNTIVTEAISYTPNFVGALLVLVFGFGLGQLLERTVENLLAETTLPEAASRTIIGKAIDATPESLTAIAGTVVGLYVYLATLFITAGLLAIPHLTSILHGFLTTFPLVIAAAIIVLAGALIAEGVGQNARASKTVDTLPASEFVTWGIEAIIHLFAVVIALSVAGIDSNLLIALLIVSVLPFGLALALALGLAFGRGGEGKASNYLDRQTSD